MASGPIMSRQVDGGNSRNSERLYFLVPKSLQMVTETMTLKDACCLEEKLQPT